MRLFSAFAASVLFVTFGISIGISAPAGAATKTFVYCSEGSPAKFNPQLASDGPSFNATAYTVYNRLVEFESGGTKVNPSLAEKWTISKDKKVYTFFLRKNVKFHTAPHFTPTRNFNADDVLFSFNRMLKADHPFHKVSGGGYEYSQSMGLDKLIKSVEKVDEHTVRFVLERPEAPFLANLAMAFASILPAEYADQQMNSKTPEKIDTDPVGTGPFVFRSYKTDSEIRYEANANYFEGKPAIDRLIFAITKDPNVRVQKLKRGECHLAAELPPADIKGLKAEGKIQILEGDGLNVGYLAFNTQKEPFNKVEVRRAIHHALNRAQYLDAIYQGNAIMAKNPIPPSMWSYDEKTEDYPYNPEMAKELLKKAGLEKGFEVNLWWLPVSRPYNPNGKRMAEMMQADLAKVGIKVNLVSYEWGTYLSKSKAGEHQMILLGWTGDNGDPDNFLNILLSCEASKDGSNVARWCNKNYDKLIESARSSSDLKKRTELYQQAQKLFKSEAPWVTLAHAKVFRAMDKRVQGFKMSPFGTDSFYGVDLK
jgi:dipeptide transport system substrate-binding protein